MTDQTATDLRDRLADVIRQAACDGNCQQTEEECREQRIQPYIWHYGKLTVVEGSPEQFAAAVLPVVQRLEAEVAAARKYAEELREFCSPHGVSVHYAEQLVEAMNRAKEGR
jgi:hypothetical protein